MATTTTTAAAVAAYGTQMWIDLTRLAAGLSRSDGDGHRWDENDARQWLRRMELVVGDGTGANPAHPRLQELLAKAG